MVRRWLRGWWQRHERLERAAPRSLSKPTISGTATVGQTLTASLGGWGFAQTYAFQWKRDGTNISGATNRTYVLQAGDSGKTVTVTVTATNDKGSTSATSPGRAIA